MKRLALLLGLILLQNCKAVDNHKHNKIEKPEYFVEKCGTDKYKILAYGSQGCKNMILYSNEELEAIGIDTKQIFKSKQEIQEDKLIYISNTISQKLNLEGSDKITYVNLLDYLKDRGEVFVIDVQGTTLNIKYVDFQVNLEWDMTKYLSGQDDELINFLYNLISK